MFQSPIYPSFAWCSLGYFFLGQGEPMGAILASMAAITIAWLAQKATLV